MKVDIRDIGRHVYSRAWYDIKNIETVGKHKGIDISHCTDGTAHYLEIWVDQCDVFNRYMLAAVKIRDIELLIDGEICISDILPKRIQRDTVWFVDFHKICERITEVRVEDIPDCYLPQSKNSKQGDAVDARIGIDRIVNEIEQISGERDILVNAMGELIATIKVNRERGHLALNVENPQFDFDSYVEKKSVLLNKIKNRMGE